MKFCNQCGSAEMSFHIPEGDNRSRYVCSACGIIHYQNPRIVAGCIPEWEGKILLCRRGIEPRYGLWTLPAGFMENGESSAAAAAREAQEEANATVDDLQLYGVYSLPHISQVYLMFRGRLRDGQAGVGHETLEIGLFAEEDVPWDQLAFTVVEDTLRLYFAERRQGVYGVHTVDIDRHADGALVLRRY